MLEVRNEVETMRKQPYCDVLVSKGTDAIPVTQFALEIRL